MSAADKAGHGMLLIPADIIDPITYVHFPDGDFRAMAKMVGGQYIERVRISETMSLAVDDEGLIRGAHVNPRASLMYGIRQHGQPICGPALLGIEEMTPEGVDWTNASADELYAGMREVIESKNA